MLQESLKVSVNPSLLKKKNLHFSLLDIFKHGNYAIFYSFSLMLFCKHFITLLHIFLYFFGFISK